MTNRQITRRRAIQGIAAGLAAPSVFRSFGHAAPSETVLHVSVGSGGMAASDIGSLTASKNLKLVAIADVDAVQAAAMAKKHPGVKVFTDWREMFDKVKFDSVIVHWYNGKRRPSEAIAKLIEPHKLPGQGSIYVGTHGVMFSPYIGMPILLGEAASKKVTAVPGNNHYLQFVEAVRGNGTTSAPFSYAGPLSEMVLLGCLATHFPDQAIEWDAAKMESPNFAKANALVRKQYRRGWEEAGL